jgi:hypothetical protein
MAFHEPPADRMMRPDSGRLCCLECRQTGDRIWAMVHERETGHDRFAAAGQVVTRG